MCLLHLVHMPTIPGTYRLSRDNEKPLARQMLMGQGKTAIITPLLCLLVVDGTRLPIVMLPSALLQAGRAIVASSRAAAAEQMKSKRFFIHFWAAALPAALSWLPGGLPRQSR